ncbi:spore photoproduct lyase [Clostridium cylindrosporum]|nr:spore photoproduct lyase [Clostridium cylindrosporum]
MPKQVFFEPKATEYPLGEELYNKFQKLNIPIQKLSSYNKLDRESSSPSEFYAFAKDSIVVGIKRSMKLVPCKPSADYQFSLVTGCPGSCQYCYLQTNQSLKPFTRVYVNRDEIFNNIQKYIDSALPNITTFELASTGDPLSVEHLTGSVKSAIEFFSTSEHGRLRLVTKFSYVDSLLDLNHNGKTKVRYTINSPYVINNFEFNTDSLENRLDAASKIYSAGYPLGFIIAPIMIYEGYKEEYTSMLESLRSKIESPDTAPITFELIQYRFTAKSKKVINERFPLTKLDLNEETRFKKWGPYGVYKYVYQKDESKLLKEFFEEKIKKYFPSSTIEYFT